MHVPIMDSYILDCVWGNIPSAQTAPWIYPRLGVGKFCEKYIYLKTTYQHTQVCLNLRIVFKTAMIC